MSLLRSDLRGVIGDALGGLFLDGSLSRNVTAYDDNGDLVTVDQNIAVKLIEESYSDIARASGVPMDQRKFIILADGLDAIPDTNDTLTFEGETLSVIAVNRDPAGATWIVETR